jgi:glycerol-3-phosphate acyltransferase PlsX
MGESPAQALREKPRASITVATGLVASGEAAAIFSAGNTGAVVMAAHRVLGLLPRVDRPALATTIPTRTGTAILLDSGATVGCRPQHLVQYAAMGAAYAQCRLGVARPRIGLLSIGEEEEKGSDLTRGAYAALSASGLNFIGNVEGRDVFNGNADVVVCDGFVGNVLLKSAEAMAELIVDMMREELVRNSRTRMGGWLARPAFANFARRTDYQELGAVPLLGVQGGCFIGHGRSNAKAMRSAIRSAAEFCEADLHRKIQEKIAQVHAEEQRLAAAGAADAAAIARP